MVHVIYEYSGYTRMIQMHRSDKHEMYHFSLHIGIFTYAPCIRWLSWQCERQSKRTCYPIETTQFSSKVTKIKALLKLPWPLLIVKLRILGLI